MRSNGDKRRESGAAMVLVIAFTTIALLTLTNAFDRLHQAIRFEEIDRRVPAGADGSELALGMAISLLHTGKPSSKNYSCRLRLGNAGSGQTSYKVKFKDKGDDQWQVTAEPGGGDKDDCPTAFGGQCS